MTGVTRGARRRYLRGTGSIPLPESSMARTRRGSRAPDPRRFLATTVGVVAVAACARADGREDVTADHTDVESPGVQEAVNALSPEEAAAGFTLLFDGGTPDAWRGYGRDDLPGGWSAIDGTLAYTPGEGSGDIITRETFTDFDLRLEWKLEPGGNSGIFFGIVEGPRRTYHSGPEIQILDNAGHPDGQNPKTSAGSNYGLHAPAEDVTRPVGEWNEVRVVREGDRIRQWLNGTLVVEYEIGTDEWNALVADSKFAEWPDYGVHHEGHIGLQDHGNPVWFRNLRIRRLP